MLSGDLDADGLLDEESWGHVIEDSRGSAGAATLGIARSWAIRHARKSARPSENESSPAGESSANFSKGAAKPLDGLTPLARF